MAHTTTQLLGLAIAFLLIGCDASAQRDSLLDARATRNALPRCEWCGLADAPARLTSTMWLASATEAGVRLIVTGTVYHVSDRTPVPDALVYAYQTNATGVYPDQETQSGNGRRHGALRGWLRTDAQGRYRIETIQPGPYPGRTDPRHIHLTVTPPNGEEWYIDAIEFDGDRRLTPAIRARREGRGGSGIVVTRDSAGVRLATRDIVLPDPGTREGSVAPSADGVEIRDSIDVVRSVVRWRGTKFGGRGSHAGVVRLASGTLARCGLAVCGGEFEINMRTIEVTDIPITDPIPRARLTEHLKSEDFFATDRYPRARFQLDSVRALGRGRTDQFVVRGALTVRDSTKLVVFPATVAACVGQRGTCIDAELRIDRRRWGITYRFDPVRNLIVDDSISIGLHLEVPGLGDQQP